MTEKSFTAAASGCWASGFGPASGPLEDHWNLDGSEPVAPTRTSCHCWFVPFRSEYWTTPVPSAEEKPGTSTAFPLLRLINRTYPSGESANRNCWFTPPWSLHWLTAALSAVDQPETSSNLPECLAFNR